MVDDEPLHFCCPVTLALLREPVIVFPEGHTFEADVIDRLPRHDSRCYNPLTRQLFCPIRDVAPNLAVRDAIIAWTRERFPAVYELRHDPPRVFVVPIEPPKVFVTLRMIQEDQSYKEYTVLRVPDDRGNFNFVIQNTPYMGAISTWPRSVNTSGRSYLGNLKNRAQRNLQDYIQTLSSVRLGKRLPCFRLFWLLFVCRFQYSDSVSETLTIHSHGRVMKADTTFISSCAEINEYLAFK